MSVARVALMFAALLLLWQALRNAAMCAETTTDFLDRRIRANGIGWRYVQPVIGLVLHIVAVVLLIYTT